MAHYKLRAGRTQNGLHSTRSHHICKRYGLLCINDCYWRGDTCKKRSVKFQVFTDNLGIRIRPSKTSKAKPRDFELLAHLRKNLRHEWHGIPVPTNVVCKTSKLKSNNKTVFALNRLWRAGEIEKFCTSIHTQSHRPNYVMWYIWQDGQTEVNLETPHFFVDKRHYPK